MTNPIHARYHGTLYGLCIGDALAMPVHWYYNRQALHDDYGIVTDYLAPRNPHPDSILWRSSYTPPNSNGDILHDQAPYWGAKRHSLPPVSKSGREYLKCQDLSVAD